MNTNSPMDDQFIDKLTQAIDKNLQDEDFGAAELAAELGMSRITLYRKVKAVVKKSVNEFIRETRLNRALELLRKGSGTVNEIAYKVGFRNPTYFNKCFHDYFGFTPGDALKGIHKLPEEKKGIKKTIKFSTILLLVFALVFISIGGLVFNVIQKKDNHNEIVIVIPPFHQENSENSGSKLKILRAELYNRLARINEIKMIPLSWSGSEHFSNMTDFEIGKALKADYVCTGTQLESEGLSKIYLNLIDVKNNKVIWPKDFEDDKINIFDFCTDCIPELTAELKIAISPTVQKIITKKPSDDPAALLLYQNGLAELQKTPPHRNVFEAKKLFEAALKRDSAIADAYVKLAFIYQGQLFFMTGNKTLKQNYKDSALMMAEKAIRYDPENAEAYGTMATYYNNAGDRQKSLKYNELNEKYGNQDADFCDRKIDWYHITWNHFMVVQYGIKYLQQLPEFLVPRRRGLELLWYNLTIMGFPEVGIKYEKMNVDQLPDKKWHDAAHLNYMAMHERFTGNFEGDKKYLIEKLKLDTTALGVYSDLIFASLCQKNFEEAYQYVLEANEIRQTKPDTVIRPDLNYGLAYLGVGQTKKAMFHIQPSINSWKDEIEKNGPNKIENCMYLASVYAALNEREKALDYLKELKKAECDYGWLMFGLKYYHSFDQLKETQEFSEVYSFIGKQYQKEHNRIKDFLKHEGLL